MNDDTTLRIERLIDATPAAVFAAWTMRDAMERWYRDGEDHTARVTELNVRVGGTYRIEFGPPGQQLYVEYGTFLEVDAPRRLVMTETLEGVDAGWEDTRVTVELHDADGKTRLVLTHERFPSSDHRDGALGGWPGFIDRIEGVLGAARTPSDPDTSLSLERLVDATREEVFAAWTTPDALTGWYAPGPGWHTPEAEVNLRAGGSYRIVFRGADGSPLTETGTYLAVERPRRLVMTNSLAGQGHAGYENSVITLTLLDEDGKTRMLVQHDGFPSRENRDMHASGWPGFIDQLERYVESR